MNYLTAKQQLSASKTIQFKNKNNEKSFSCRLNCARCIGASKSGKQCGHRVCIGLPLCYQHSLAYLKLRTARTQLHSGGERLKFSGLFTCNPKAAGDSVVFKAGDLVCPYLGEPLSKKQVDERYGKNGLAPYVNTTTSNTNAQDGACSRTLGSTANRDAHPNVKFAIINVKDKPKNNRAGIIYVLKATTDIHNGDEVLLPVHGYPIEEPGESHCTKGYKPAAVC